QFAMITGGDHKVMAVTTGLYASLRVDKGPDEFIAQAGVIYDKLLGILEASHEGQRLSGDERDAEKLFAELQRVARELYTFTNTVAQSPSLSQAHYVQKAVERTKKVLARMRILE
ncbi:MAG: hypothetical protein PVF45_08895, partial [Anaerolineae bacterium]